MTPGGGRAAASDGARKIKRARPLLRFSARERRRAQGITHVEVAEQVRLVGGAVGEDGGGRRRTCVWRALQQRQRGCERHQRTRRAAVRRPAGGLVLQGRRVSACEEAAHRCYPHPWARERGGHARRRSALPRRSREVRNRQQRVHSSRRTRTARGVITGACSLVTRDTARSFYLEAKMQIFDNTVLLQAKRTRRSGRSETKRPRSVV